MKFLPSQIAYILSELNEGELKRNLGSLGQFAAVLVGSLALFTILFHLIMVFEDQQHSWLTGLYWTLTVMSTLGFGDITFESDLGRAFTIFVLIYGIVMLLIVAPFTFIRFFYAPWLEAQIRLRAPRKVDESLADHVVICGGHDSIAQGLIGRLNELAIPYVVVEPDTTTAVTMHSEGIHVVTGRRDARATYEAARVEHARTVIANLDDAENTNITLTVREVTADVPIIAFAEDVDSIDVLELAGATFVIPLKQRLGEQLAARVTAGMQSAHRIGRFEDLIIAEFPIHGTALVGRTIRDTNLRHLTGLNIVGVWERGQIEPAGPETVLHEHSVPVVVGTDEQVTDLDALFVIYHAADTPVLVIGGGTVGRAVSQALRDRGASVTILDHDASLEAELAAVADRVVIGDGSSLQTVKAAGIEDAPSVVLTTNDDATNVFLTVYCRRLSSDAHIVSRISHDWNVEAIHRAGADFALSRASLGIQTLVSQILGRELIVVGEGTELFVEPIPDSLVGKTLASSEIGAKTGLNVIGLRAGGEFVTNPIASTELEEGCELVMLGTAEQYQRFLSIKVGKG
ncbi:MAG: potassium transporter TrkA [Deltaproteobacteria bacterium]|nr:potassium transporter TrkA [Deltaproteobacteria bacterium]